MYNPGKHISIDKGVHKWKGRLSFRVYNKNKPIEYGIKSYILCDSDNGYCDALDVYATEGLSLEQTEQWHSLYMDNFHNSVELSESLLTDKVHTVGTLRKNRRECKDIRNAGNNKENKLRKGDAVAKDNGKVMTTCWMDKNPVRALTREKEKVMKPVCITNMSGVDHLDQMTSYYPCTREGHKWWKELLLFLVKINIHNTHILYNSRGGNVTIQFSVENCEIFLSSS